MQVFDHAEGLVCWVQVLLDSNIERRFIQTFSEELAVRQVLFEVLEIFLELLFEVRVQGLVHDVVLCQKDKVKVSEQGPMLMLMGNFLTLHMRLLA